MKLDFTMKNMVNISIISKEWIALGLMGAVLLNIIGLIVPDVSIKDFIVHNCILLVALYMTKGVATITYDFSRAKFENKE